jgi:hypothetical protein
MGFPIAEDNSIGVGLSIRFDQGQRPTRNSPTIVTTHRSYQHTFGIHEHHGLLLNSAWANDERDSVIYTTKGTVQRAYSEVGCRAAT